MADFNSKVSVALGARSYDILISTDLMKSCGDFILPFCKKEMVCVITDNNVGNVYLNSLTLALKKVNISVNSLSLEPGEQTKSWTTLQKVVEWLIEQEVERDDCLIALGGGVIGDLVGFSASILRRGVGVIQMPTSLLAQVDSSVGGKTAINSEKGKNLVGTFFQPSMVLSDINVLKTLPRRQLLSGFSEVIKYGLIADKRFYFWLEENANHILSGEETVLGELVKKSCEIKAKIVEADEKESGKRALLNFGHTFGHALEALTNYSERLLHGEGVSIGCVLALKLSSSLGFCSAENVTRVIKFYKKMGMKTSIREILDFKPSTEQIIKVMHQDKKVKKGQLTFILATDIGCSFISHTVKNESVKNILFADIYD